MGRRTLESGTGAYELAEPITRDRLEAEFGNDPLFDAVQRMNLINELFDDESLSVLVDRHEYTTTDFEKWYCMNESDPRYLSTPGIMRAFVKELGTYLQTRNIGRTIIFDYEGVLKLKMALLLRKYGMKPALIYETAGAKAYSAPVAVHRSQNPSFTQTPSNPPQTQKGVLYDQLMESLLTQLTAAGAVRQGADGKLQVDLTTLIEKHIESMASSLLPAGLDQTQEKLDGLESEVTGLKETLERQASEKILSQEKEAECRARADGLYMKIKSAKDISEAEEFASQLRSLEEEYHTDFLYIVRDYEYKADMFIVQLRLDEKLQKENKIKEECLQLYNVMIDPNVSKAEVDKAKDQLVKIQEDNPNLALDIRMYITNAQYHGNKEKSGGFLGWLFNKSSKR